MQAPYVDPRTKLRYADPEVFKQIRNLPDEYVQRYLALRNAAVVLRWQIPQVTGTILLASIQLCNPNGGCLPSNCAAARMSILNVHRGYWSVLNYFIISMWYFANIYIIVVPCVFGGALFCYLYCSCCDNWLLNMFEAWMRHGYWHRCNLQHADFYHKIAY
jgi:hypothetical protein